MINNHVSDGIDRLGITGGLWSMLVLPLLLFSPVAISKPVWISDHHMHVGSADLCRITQDCLTSNRPPAVLAIDVVHALDAAGISKGVVLSCGYLYGMASLHLSADEVETKTRRENQFTADQVAQFPQRLVGFLSVDPLQPSAISEIQYWRNSRQLVGLKLHFAASSVNMRNAAHRVQVSKVIAAAASSQMPIVIHFGNGTSDEVDAELFIREVLPAAGQSWVQIAHLGGGAPIEGEERTGPNAIHPNLRVLESFANHVSRGDPSTRHLLFDLSYAPLPNNDKPAQIAFVVRQMRRIGISRFVFGSDYNVLTPVKEIARLKMLKLTQKELAVVQKNCAPWAC
jgi:predicted TIM-barrel fold metal-dependent hydrolase